MNKSSTSRHSREDLEVRIQTLEEQARFTFDVLEMASNLGDFQTSINKLQEPTEILAETAFRLNGLIPFSGCVFYLVDENSSDFKPAWCTSEEQAREVRRELDYLIDNGIFSLALRENRPITVYSRSQKFRFVLHALATCSRTRGMFVGLTLRSERNISSVMLSLLSIVLKNCANAIESFELYRLFRFNEQRYRELADFFPCPMFEADANGQLRLMNDAALRVFGYADALPGPDFNACMLFAPDSRAMLQTCIQTLLNRDLSGCRTLDCQGLRSDGTVFPVALRIGPVFFSGQEVGLRGLVLGEHMTPNDATEPDESPA